VFVLDGSPNLWAKIPTIGYTLIFVGLLLLVLAPVEVKATGAAVEREKISVRSVQADFIQEKNLKILVRPILSRGRFVFQAPGNLRWEYTTPFRSVLLLYEGKIRKFTEHDGALVEEKGLRLDAMQLVLGEISGWLNGRFTDNAAFTTEIRDERTVVLSPKEEGMRSFISRIELKLADQAGLLDSVTIFEGPDSSTRLIFSHAVLNQPIARTLFTRP